MIEALPPAAMFLAAGASAIAALRCLADRLLPSALVYTVAACGLAAAAAKLAVDAL